MHLSAYCNWITPQLMMGWCISETLPQTEIEFLRHRLWDFHGSDAEYIAMLESKLLDAECRLSVQACTSCLSSNSTSCSTTSPGDLTIHEPEFVYYHPARDRQKNEKRKQRGTTRWRVDLNNFLGLIPSMDKWAQKRIDTGFSTVEKNRIAIQILLGRSTEGIFMSEDTGCELPKLKSTDKQSMIARGCSYGSLSQQAREHGIFTMLLAKFHQLVFISYCTVLLSVLSVPPDTAASRMHLRNATKYSRSD
ncbi:conserved hypothetical protein [Histoplasma capsulatum var. duboisii H88]|uniref:Uncharacterized protein n=1 Tax=Ajellomyces capsulatus (strain H88) TaxID=544711 RepID=F0U9P6_AJEC8|nr:conserved hypothetical protein [Histoplasma capsulatum var. duboisii H88]